MRAPREPRRLIAAVAAAIVLVALLALLSRLHPAWFPSADQTADFLADSRERLSYPLNYWNALGALIAIGLPLVLQISASAKTVLVRALAAAALPAMLLTIFFTLSRGGDRRRGPRRSLVYLAVSDDRLPKLLTALVAGLGGAVLIGLAAGHEALRHGLTNSAAHDQGDELLLIGLVVCAVVGLRSGRDLEAAAARASGRAGPCRAATSRWPPSERWWWCWWSRPRRPTRPAAPPTRSTNSRAAATPAPAPRASTASPARAATRSGARRSTRARSAPLIGTGAGTFAYWWYRDAAGTEAVQDAHSLYLQTLGELGIVGLLLLLGFLGVVLGGGTLAALRAGPERALLAAALAGCVAFFLAAAVDWNWQMPALPVAALLLASALVMATRSAPRAETLLRRLPLRIGLAAAALVAVVAIAVPLASTSLIRSSESAVRSGDLEAALADARSAENVQPGAATPRLQQALVLELQGDLPGAAAAAQAATERESTNWRPWLVLSRIEAERGRVDAAVAAFREARSLNPLSPLFDRESQG